VSTTSWIRLFGPSVRYDKAQQASARIYLSLLWIRWAKTGRSYRTAGTLGGRFLLRHKLDKVQATLRKNVA
jgi:hypothetical protein